jgi:hypothetical protein
MARSEKKPAVRENPNMTMQQELDDVLNIFVSRYGGKALSIEQGRNRRVYVMKAYVVKVPVNQDGIADNHWEGSVSNSSQYPQSDWQVQFARTRLVFQNGIPIVYMERVEEATSGAIHNRLGRVPNWIGCVDCGQVGFTKRGALVAYDYGIR